MDQALQESLVEQIKGFTQTQVPMMSYAGVDIVEIDGSHCVIKIPLKSETKNHLQSMYFGALSIGADAAGGLIALYQILQVKENVSLVFQDFQAKFLRRAEGDVFFSCHEGQAISDLVQKAISTGERVKLPVHVTATTPGISGDQPVAEFVLTLSLKLRQ